MRKKKRSAAQLRNDRRLGRMAKARAKAKRGGRRKKVARKKNVHYRAASKQRIKRVIKKAKRKVSAKSHLWQVALFAYTANQLYFYGGIRNAHFAYTIDRDKALFFKTKAAAQQATKTITIPLTKLKLQVGIVPDNVSVAQLKQQFKEQMGKT